MAYKILLVEDEESIRSFIKVFLKNNNFEVEEAETGEEALEKIKRLNFDLVLLDVMLPSINGFKVCEILREEYKGLGIIMLTARGQDIDRIEGLENGADDYIVKPFNPKELLLRIKSVLRRTESSPNKESVEILSAPFRIDIYSQRLFKNEKEIDTTPKEFILMKTFMENAGKAFSREDLLNRVWGWDFYGESKIVDVNIRRLRTKIEEDPSNPKYIETVWGIGYRWANN
ncbi:response regulator transcription factor [Hathewaya histolytica]|uniref:Stage 0 sporulation protein A homolog n=1 Tax=Hathewaya histolytica TaxID=1498 RepID=A0A4U9R425_HATHI|nr:response regulator transcription factor [Hathewaya histolytica]VTQ85819.1 DNA-binding response regulator [Hathewaya histolytica]